MSKKQKQKKKVLQYDDDIIESKYANILKNLEEDQNLDEDASKQPQLIQNDSSKLFFQPEILKDIKKSDKMDKQKFKEQEEKRLQEKIQKDEEEKKKLEQRKIDLKYKLIQRKLEANEKKKQQLKNNDGNKEQEGEIQSVSDLNSETQDVDDWQVVNSSDEEEEAENDQQTQGTEGEISIQKQQSSQSQKPEQIVQKVKKIRNPKKIVKKSQFWDNICIISILVIFMLLLGLSKYFEEKYMKVKHLNFGDDQSSDLYEILEVDSSASLLEIKKQYRKLAVTWHPDKNPGCDKTCQNKFQMIASAYEVLGNEERRRTYDQTYGVVNKIKSKAIQLNEKNFEQFVHESNDVWIIMVYEDGDGFCEYMSKFWESAVEKYSSIVKFGRINKETAYEALLFFPVKIPIIPTILSYENDKTVSTYTFDRRQPELSLYKFVGQAITGYVTEFTLEQSSKIFGKLNQYDSEQKIAIVLLCGNNKVPLEYKYASFKYNEQIEFYQNSYGSLKQIQNLFSKDQKGNLIVFYNNEETKKREKVEFQFENQQWNHKRFKEILSVIKMLSIPQVDRGSFRDWCETTHLRELDEDQSDKQTLCIIIPEETQNNNIEHLKLAIFNQSIKKFINNQPLFAEIKIIQFVQVDFGFQWKIKNLLDQGFSKQHEGYNGTYQIAGIFPENKKIAYLTNFNQLEDFIYDLIENEGQFLYIQELLQGKEISSLMKFKHETRLNNLYIKWKKITFQWKMYISFIVLSVSIWKMQYKDSWMDSSKFSIIILFSMSIIMVILEQFEDLIH